MTQVDFSMVWRVFRRTSLFDEILHRTTSGTLFKTPLWDNPWTRYTSSVRDFHRSALIYKSSTPPPSSTSPRPNIPHEVPSVPSFNLFHAIRASRPAVRYTIYAGLGLMVTVESIFWFNVIKAKFFPSKSDKEKEKAEELLTSVREAIAGYKKNWMINYGRYYGGYIWGVGER